MDKDKRNKIMKWVAIAAIVVIAVILYRNYTKNREQNSSNQNSNTNSGDAVLPNAPVVIGNQPRYVGTDFKKWGKNDELIAVAPIVNIYSSKLISSNSLEKTVSKGEKVGTLLGIDGNFAKIAYYDYIAYIPVAKFGYVFLSKAVSQAPNVTNK